MLQKDEGARAEGEERSGQRGTDGAAGSGEQDTTFGEGIVHRNNRHDRQQQNGKQPATAVALTLLCHRWLEARQGECVGRNDVIARRAASRNGTRWGACSTLSLRASFRSSLLFRKAVRRRVCSRKYRAKTRWREMFALPGSGKGIAICVSEDLMQGIAATLLERTAARWE